jgi:hypothetical protein
MTRAMTRQPGFLISVAALLALTSLAHAQRSPYDTIKSAPQFAIGGVGYSGVITSEELAMRKLQLTVREYKAPSEPYPHGSPVINRMDGCIQHPEAVSDTVEWIDKWAVKIKSWEKKP